MREGEAVHSAVAIHDRDAEWFDAQYEGDAAHRNEAFWYGRKKCDQYLWDLVDRVPPGTEALDVGCGTGAFIARLRERGVQAVGIEPSAKMRELAHRRLPPETVIDGSVLRLPYGDDSFDLVTAIEVFRYLDTASNERGFAEVHRVIRPGGAFFGTFVNRYAFDAYYLLVQARRLRGAIGGRGVDHHTEFETPSQLRHRFARAGFARVEIFGAMFAPLRIAYRYFPRVGRPLAERVEPYDELLTRPRGLRAVAGHLIAIAWK